MIRRVLRSIRRLLFPPPSLADLAPRFLERFNTGHNGPDSDLSCLLGGHSDTTRNASMEIRDWFDRNPQHKDGVLKAIEAFGNTSHKFSSAAGWGRCVWCGRTREEVRWDDLPALCQNRPNTEICPATVVLSEEVLYFENLRRAKSVVPRIIAARGLSDETLRFLWETHGFDKETVEDALV